MSDRGAAAVVVLAAAGVLLALAAGAGAVASLWAARAQASAAADAAALAAAPVTFRPFGAAGSPAAEAARYAAANGARLVACRCPVNRSWARRTVEVVVALPVSVPGIGAVEVRGAARAEFWPLALVQVRGRGAPMIAS